MQTTLLNLWPHSMGHPKTTMPTNAVFSQLKCIEFILSDIRRQHGPEHGAEALPQQPRVGAVRACAAADVAQADRDAGGGHRVPAQGRLRRRLLQGQLGVGLR